MKLLPHPTTLIIIWGITSLLAGCSKPGGQQVEGAGFSLKMDEAAGTIAAYTGDGSTPVITQVAKEDMRPYLHPIMSPDGKGALTEYSPGHHKHQTGLYWGFTRVNGTGAPVDTLKKWFYNRNKPQRIKNQVGRDFFHFNGATHWKKQSAKIVAATGSTVRWQTVYHMLDEAGTPILEETMNWSLREEGAKRILGLEWKGKALTDITINQFSYGGMFLRMPWRKGIQGEAINDKGQRNQEAEGQQAHWVDVGMEIAERKDWGHICIMEHPGNGGFPTAWRVDGQLGIGPTRAIAGDWHIKEGDTEIMRHQIVAYTGDLDAAEMQGIWEVFAKK